MAASVYARIFRGNVDETDTLQNQRTRLTSVDIDVAHIYLDIISGAIFLKGSVF